MKLKTTGIILSILISSAVSANDNNYEKALTAYHDDQIEAAFIHLKNALQENPNSLHAKLLYADVLVAKDLYQEAELELTEALEMGADVNLVVKPLTDVLLYRGQFTRVLSVFDGYSLNPQSEYQYQLSKGRAQTGLKDYEAAINTYENLSLQYPDDLDVQLGIISVYFSTGQLERAEQNLSVLKPHAASNEKVSRYIATLAYERGDYPEALAFFQKANQLEPDNVQSIRGMVNTYMSLQQFDKADIWVDKLTELTPYDPQARLLQAIVLSQTDNEEKANRLLSTLSEQLSTADQTFMVSQPQLLLIDAMASYGQQNWEQASKKFKTYIKHSEDQFDIRAVVLLADVYNRLNRPKQALELLSSHEEELVQHKDFALLLAGAYIKYDKKYDSDKLLTQLRNLYGSDPGVLLLSAHDLSNRGKSQQAIEMLTSTDIPQDNNYKHTLAALYLNAGEFEKSLVLSSELVKGNPENISYQLLKIKAQIATDKIGEAEQGLLSLYEANKEEPKVQFEYARLLFNKGQRENSRKELNKLVNLYPEIGLYRLTLAEVEYSLGEIPSAIRSLQMLTTDSQYQIQALYKLSLIYLQYQQFNQSLDAANQILRLDPVNLDAMYTKARALARLERIDAAQIQCEKLYSWWLEDAPNLYKLSKLQTQLGLYEGASKSLSRAMTLAPDVEPIKISLVKLYIRQNKLSEASSLITTMEKSGNSGTLITLLKGELAQAEGSTDKAFNYFSQVLKQDKSNVVAFMNLYGLARNKGYSQKFADIAEETVNKYPEKPFYRSKLADHLMWMESWEQAKYHYQILLTNKIPRNDIALALNNLAVIYIGEGNLEQAIQMSQQAVGLYPQIPAFSDTAGWALVQSGDMQKGLEQLRQAYSMNASDPEVLYHLIYTLSKLDKKAEAKAMLDIIKAAPKNNRFRIEAEKLNIQ